MSHIEFPKSSTVHKPAIDLWEPDSGNPTGGKGNPATSPSKLTTGSGKPEIALKSQKLKTEQQ